MLRLWLGVVFAAGCYRSTDPPPAPPKHEREREPSATPAGATPRSRQAPARRESDPMAQAISDFRAFRDEICACPDQACADRVMKDIEAWAATMPYDPAAVSADEAVTKELTEISQTFGPCMVKLPRTPHPPHP